MEAAVKTDNFIHICCGLDGGLWFWSGVGSDRGWFIDLLESGLRIVE